MDKLSEETIRQYIDKTISTSTKIYIVDSVDSTNRFLKEFPPNNELSICCAETQTHGKGRMGRSWYSPYGENIYFSARFPIHNSVNKLSGLSLVASLTVIETLRSLNLGSDLSLKWPNDILWHQKKLSGCLVELILENHVPSAVVIGIGINVNSRTTENPLSDKEWCSLLDITGKHQNRNIIIGKLIKILSDSFNRLLMHGFKSFISSWQSVDYLKGKKISVSHLDKCIKGSVEGVDDFGHLILIDECGETRFLSSGDTTSNVDYQN